MDVRDRWVLVRADALADLLEQIERVLPDLDDMLRRPLTGAIAEVRVHSIPEPTFESSEP
jgi:hypothetical protein